MIPAKLAVKVAMPSLAQEAHEAAEDATAASSAPTSFSMLARMGPLDASVGAPARIMSPILQKLPLTEEDFASSTPSAEAGQIVDWSSLTRSIRFLVAGGRYASAAQFCGSAVPLQHFLVQTLMRRGETAEAKRIVAALVRRWGAKSAWPSLALGEDSEDVPDEALAASVAAVSAAGHLTGAGGDAGGDSSAPFEGAVGATSRGHGSYWSCPLRFASGAATSPRPADTPCHRTVLLVDSATAITRMVEAVESELAAALGPGSVTSSTLVLPVGVDAEWRPDGWGPHPVTESEATKASWPVSVFQIALGSHVFLIDCLALHALLTDNESAGAAAATCLRALLSHPAVVTVGVGAADDLVRVASSLPGLLPSLRVVACDLQAAAGLAADTATATPASAASTCSMSLSSCVEAVLGAPLDKTAQVSDWQHRPLSPRQLVYSALDAAAPLEVLAARFGAPPYVGAAAEALLAATVEVVLPSATGARLAWPPSCYLPAAEKATATGASRLPGAPASYGKPAPGVCMAIYDEATGDVLGVSDPGVPGGRGPRHVAAALQAAGVPLSSAFVHTPGSETVESSAAAVGCPPSAIVKSLAFWVGPLPVIVLAAGVAKVDTKRLRAAAAPLMASRGVPPGASTKVRFATAEECTGFFGFEPGTFPPGGHRDEVVVLLDASVPAGVEAAKQAAAAAAALKEATGEHGARGEDDWQPPPDVSFEDVVEAYLPTPATPKPELGSSSSPDGGAATPDPASAPLLWEPGVLFAGGGRHDLSIRVTLEQLQALLQARADAAAAAVAGGEPGGQPKVQVHPSVLVDVTKGGDAAALVSTPMSPAPATTPLAATSAEAGAGRAAAEAASNASITNPRFIVDSMLGRLQRWLRVVGVDAAGSAGFEAAEYLAARSGVSAAAAASLSALATPLEPDLLLAWANASGRILITRDRKLYQRKDTCPMIFCYTNDTATQFEFLSDHYGLMVRPEDLMSRCAKCNGMGYDYRTPDDIRAIMAADPGRQGPRPKVLDSVTDYWTCRRPQCQQIFWTGKKFQETRDHFAALFDDVGRAAALTTFVPGRPQVPGGGDGSEGSGFHPRGVEL